jgi:hypothetical protein
VLSFELRNCTTDGRSESRSSDQNQRASGLFEPLRAERNSIVTSAPAKRRRVSSFMPRTGSVTALIAVESTVAPAFCDARSTPYASVLRQAWLSQTSEWMSGIPAIGSHHRLDNSLLIDVSATPLRPGGSVATGIRWRCSICMTSLMASWRCRHCPS